MEIIKNYRLAPLTTFKIGGRAEFFLEAKTAKDLLAAVKWARRRRLTVRWFGGGSNLLVKDGLVSGLVIRLAPGKIKIDGTILKCDAGATLAQAVKLAGERGLAGLEWAVGIPGTIGGAARGNAGAFGGEVGQNIISVKALDFKKMKVVTLSRRQCGFAYRSSKFKKDDRWLIIYVELKLKSGATAAIKERVKTNLLHRSATQPKQPSAGSVFKNLFLSDLKKENSYLANLAAKAGKVKGGKVPAAWLIERLDLKGKKIGGAKISLEHANFIVNCGQASFEDVKNLINLVKNQAKIKLKISLEEEIQYFGG